MSGERRLRPLVAATAILLAPSASAAPDAAVSNAENAQPSDGPAPPAAPAPPVPRAGEHHIGFSDSLSVRADLLLEGTEGTAHVDFTVPEGWELLEDPVLHLRYSHSAALRPDRSHLTVSLDGRPIATVPLDADNGEDGTLEARLPRRLLSAYDHLELRAVQHTGAACEDPFDASLWTRVDKESYITMVAQPKEATPDLARLPYPLFDRTEYGPAVVSLVVPATPAAGTLGALGRLGLALGRLADYRGVQVDTVVSDVRNATSNALLVGPWAPSTGIPRLVGGEAPAPGEGLVALLPNPADPTLSVLVVTGGDDAGLARATSAVAAFDRYPVLSGSVARVGFTGDDRPPKSRREPPSAPDTDSFPLASLGLADQTVRGFFTPPLRMPLELGGDAVVRQEDAALTVRYAYAAGLDPRRSAMEIRLDGLTVGSVALDDPDGSTGSEARVRLSEVPIGPSPTLELAFTLHPKDYDPCEFTKDRGLWATVYSTSTLDLPRDHVAEIPDLGRLRFGMWPLSMRPGDGPVIAALPDKPTADDVQAGFQLATALGRWTTSDEPDFTLRTAAGMDFAEQPDAQYVLLGSGGKHALLDRLAATGALSLRGTEVKGVRSLFDLGQPAMTARVELVDAVVEQVKSPVNPERVALVLTTAGTPLAPLVERVTDPAHVGELQGNLALVSPDGDVRTLQTAERTRIGSFPASVRFSRALRRHWILLGASVLAGAATLTTLKRLWLRARENG